MAGDISIVYVSLMLSGNVQPLVEHLMHDGHVWDLTVAQDRHEYAVNFTTRPGAFKIFGRLLLSKDDVVIRRMDVDAY